jgi:hypothetical protein
MPVSELRLILRCVEFRSREEMKRFPRGIRGLYTLLNRHVQNGKEKFDVVYIGMARGSGQGVGGRLRSHARSKRKGKLWTHFSVFQVWDNITESEVAELEGLFRHIYRKDSRANRINRQKSFKKLTKVRDNKVRQWPS